jgi:hypothetical protein
MGTAGTLLVIALTPTAVAGAVLGARRAVAVLADRRRSARASPAGPPLERVAADLRRLLAERRVVRASPDLAVRARRLQALECAVTDCALEAARALDVPAPDRPGRQPLPRAQLNALLSALAEAGLVLPPEDR